VSAVGAKQPPVCEPADHAHAVCVEDRQALIVGRAQRPYCVLERLVQPQLRGLVQERLGVEVVGGASNRLLDVGGGDDAEQHAVAIDHR